MEEKQGQFSNYTTVKVVGKGTFGMVYLVKDSKGKMLAIKHVLQDKRYKNRELEIAGKLNHPNIVRLEDFFYDTSSNKQYLNLVLQFVPENLSQKIRACKGEGKFLPNEMVKIYSQQILKGLHYLSEANVCHRDIKPSNILVGGKDLKLCDFGSAKCLVEGEKNISYICSRYYRAPELIFGAVSYTNQVDVWSAACVIAEMVINKPIFEGENSTDQLAKIMRIIGTPSPDQIKNMKAKQLAIQLPAIQPMTVKKYLNKLNPFVDPLLVDLLTRLFVYDPSRRLTPAEALSQPYFSQKEKGKV